MENPPSKNMNKLCVDVMDELLTKEESKHLYSNKCVSSCEVPETVLKNDTHATKKSVQPKLSSSHEIVQKPYSDQVHATEIAGKPHPLGVPQSTFPQLICTNDPRLLLQAPQKRELRVQSRSLSWPTHGLSVSPYISYHPGQIAYNNEYNHANIFPTAPHSSTNAAERAINSNKLVTKGQDSIRAPNERTDNQINVHHQLSVSFAGPYQQRSNVPSKSHPSQKLEQSLDIRRTPITSNATSQTKDSGNEKSDRKSPEKRNSKCLGMDTSQLSESIDNLSTINTVKSLLRELFNPNNMRILSDFLGESSEVHGPNDMQEITEKQEKVAKELSTSSEKNNVLETLKDNQNTENDVALENQKIKTPPLRDESPRSTRAYLRGRETSQDSQQNLASIIGKKREIINLSDQPPIKRAKQSRSIEGNNRLKDLNRDIKNNNLEWHSLNKEMHCKICDKPQGRSLVSHYINDHPNVEVHTSRISPDVAKLIHTSKNSFECEVIHPRGSEQKIRQFCYFCNDYKCYSRLVWIDHTAVHTGYYQYECIDCSRKFAVKNRTHACYKKNNLEDIPQPHFHKENLMAYICDLCNYVRFDKTEIEKHLRCEHEGKVSKRFKEILFLRLPYQKKKRERESKRSENDSGTKDDDAQLSSEKARVETSKETKFVKVELVRKPYLRDTDISQQIQPKPSIAETNKTIETIAIPDVPIKEESQVNEIDDGPISESKNPKIESLVAQPVIKNNNPEWHSLKTEIQCQVCDKVLKKTSVNHYVNLHPNSEVFTSRLAPDVANSLRNGNHQYEIIRPDEASKCANYLLKQFCYFCNELKCLTRWIWIDHLVSHTGYYQYECNDCSKKFVRKSVHHVCKDENNLQMIPQPHFRAENLFAYVCDLCNYVRFDESEIKKHLNCEHEGNVTDEFKKILFSRLSTKRKNRKIADLVEEKQKDEHPMVQIKEESSQEKETSSSSSDSTSDSSSASSNDSDSDSDVSSSVSSKDSNCKKVLTNDEDSDSWESISDNDSDIMQVVCSAESSDVGSS